MNCSLLDHFAETPTVTDLNVVYAYLVQRNSAITWSSWQLFAYKVGSENTAREATVELLFALMFYNQLICSLYRKQSYCFVYTYIWEWE